VIVLAALTASLSLLVHVGVSVIRRRRRQAASDAGVAILRTPIAVAAGLTLVFLVGLVAGFAQLLVLHDDRFVFGVPGWFVAVLWLPVPIVGALCWAVARWNTARSHGLSRIAALAYGWCACSTAAFLVVLWHWNLFGPHL
jgi:hypothetical protein